LSDRSDQPFVQQFTLVTMLAGDMHLWTAMPELAGLAKLDLFAIDGLDVRFAIFRRGAALFAAHATMVGVRLLLGGILLGTVWLDVALDSTMVTDEILVSRIRRLVIAIVAAIL